MMSCGDRSIQFIVGVAGLMVQAVYFQDTVVVTVIAVGGNAAQRLRNLPQAIQHVVVVTDRALQCILYTLQILRAVISELLASALCIRNPFYRTQRVVVISGLIYRAARISLLNQYTLA